ncbi:hypothetical protein PtrM4_137960 [Pyrenophora tritici-repentis]|uniref:Uncharacterized protein n=1 Tax=Pyrenophora tritici-repentis TaxID=45151 RepID=A0A834VKM3_9PLEO|nr:hypothetical protein PtrM4_137960 [Pyrenophora tritici-repentis]KAI1515575.1 hypothetical protein Ptr86124_005576 [Pyrenophora tritici-repentis]KAI1678563.1 hypothetical protein KJE20_12171 [Pyrenophora tritici-repentis]
MTTYQLLYIVTYDVDVFGAKSPRVLGAFFTYQSAIAAVENLSPRPTKLNWCRYDSEDGEIIIKNKSLDRSNSHGAAHETMYLAIHACGTCVVDFEPFSTEDAAWNACMVFRNKKMSSVVVNGLRG